jgi:hypothetical protein
MVPRQTYVYGLFYVHGTRTDALGVPELEILNLEPETFKEFFAQEWTILTNKTSIDFGPGGTAP